MVAVSALLLGTVLAAYPPRAQTVDADTLHGHANDAISTVLDLSQSGEDPIGDSVIQKRVHLKKSHQRLDDFGDAMKLVLKKIGDMTSLERGQIENAFDVKQQGAVSVLGEIGEWIDEGILVTSEGVDILEKLKSLQEARSTLFVRGDLNAPFLIRALAYELVLLEALQTDEQKIAETKEAHLDRFLMMLNGTRAGSLADMYRELHGRVSGSLMDAHKEASILDSKFVEVKKMCEFRYHGKYH